MNLIIVESPTKARTLSRFLGRDFVIEPTMGHIRDLPESKLGVDVDKNFEPEYVLVAKKKDAVGRIKQEAKRAEKVFLATDPDREGEAIAYHVAALFGRRSNVGNSIKSVTPDRKFARVVFHEITESAVKHALENPRDIDIDLFHAQQARRVLDRLVGYKLSPLLWRKIRRGLSAGRVQSVAVRLIVEREREIEAFVPEEYWEIWVGVSKKGKGEREFVVRLIEKDGEKIKIQKKEEADSVVADLNQATYQVASVDKKEVSRRPPTPFTTSTMAQSGNRNFFWSAKKTMAVAQRLYEEGLITYHRTDSLQLAKEAVFAARKFIEGEYGRDFLPEKPRFYKTRSRVAQEAHEAIRPTSVGVTSDKQQVTSVGTDAKKLYGLIWKRFVACQMANSVFDETTVSVEAIRNKQYAISYMLQATGQVMKFEGWKKVYSLSQSLREEEHGEQRLPEVQKDEPLELVKVDPQQKFTQALPRYTEASLIKTLEKLGIGRPSTYAPTISTIQDRQYVDKEEGKFIPTALGFAVSDFLVKYFSDIVDYEFTAHMEGDLDEIARGEKRWAPVIRDFWNPFSGKLEKVTEKAERVHVEVEETGEACPKCGEGEAGRQVIRVGRFGKFLSCSRFPECDWKAAYIQKVGMKCPGCSEGDAVVKKTRKGRMFYGCSRYPKCKWASWRKPKAV